MPTHTQSEDEYALCVLMKAPTFTIDLKDQFN